jgi:hypothetical protein
MAIAGWFGLSAQAAAQARPALGDVLEVRADDAGCVTEPALRSRVQRWLKPQSIAPDVRVQVDAAASPPRFSVRRGSEEVAARSFDVLPAACGDRLNAIAIAVALAIEHATHPESTEAAPPDTGATPPSDTNTTAPEVEKPAQTPETPPNTALPTTSATPPEEKKQEEPQETEADRRAARARRLGPHVYAGGGVMFEVLPEPVGAFALGADLPLAWLRLDAALLATTRSTTDIDPGKVHTNLLAGRALVCAEAPFGLAGCAGAGGGAALASGTGYLQPNHTAAAWLAGIVRGSMRFPASARLSLRLAADALFNIVRPQLVVKGTDGGKAAGRKVGVAGSLELLLALP